MGRRILSEALSKIVNAEKRGFATAQLQPVSNVMASFLNIMKYRGYIKDFQVHDIHRVGKITVELQGRVKDCRALTYRQDIKAQDIEEYRVRNLPTRQLPVQTVERFIYTYLTITLLSSNPTYIQKKWGYVVITTPNGIMDHEEAIRQNVGGQVLGYFY